MGTNPGTCTCIDLIPDLPPIREGQATPNYVAPTWNGCDEFAVDSDGC